MQLVLCALAAALAPAAAMTATRTRAAARTVTMAVSGGAETEPLLLRAARGEKVERAPVWMMRQAGRHMAAYRALVEKYPTFRDRSETPEAALEISLQPWKSYGVDGVILFSDILTPLPAMGVDFDISEGGAIKIQPIRTREALAGLKKIEVKTAAPFVGEVLGKLREAVGNTATVLGFIGLPFTLASYCVEGKTGTTTGFAEIAAMRENDPALLHDLLALLADNIADYACYQIESGAQVMQIFDSWAGHLPEPAYREFALKYQQRVVKTIKARHPTTPIIIYAAPDVHSRDGKLLHLLVEAGADVARRRVSIDHTVALDSSIVASTIPAALGIQGNLDPKVLRDGPLSLIKEQTEAILKAGMDRGFHMMNLGHGIEATTPEPHAKFFVDTVQNYKYAEKKA